MASPALADQLRDQLARCRRKPLDHQRLKLSHGLRVTMYVDGSGDAHVLLLRDGRVGPSDQEAATVLKHWPEAKPARVDWIRGTSGKVSWLAATLVKPRQLKLGEGGT